MKHKLKFNLDRVKRALDHSRKDPNLRAPYGLGPDLEGPSLLLVKDQGVYLMANSKGDDRDHVIYAHGFNPKTVDPEILWDRSRAVMGGDDGVDALPEEFIEAGINNAIIRGQRYLTIVVDGESLMVE